MIYLQSCYICGLGLLSSWRCCFLQKMSYIDFE